MNRLNEFNSFKEPIRTRKKSSSNDVASLIETLRLKQFPVFLMSNRKQQFPSFVLLLSVVILIILSPFQLKLDTPLLSNDTKNLGSQVSIFSPTSELTTLKRVAGSEDANHHRSYFESYIIELLQSMSWFKLKPIRLTCGRYNQAEAKVLGKMAKMWYIKKKLKKLGKKLKKHTIAVPVFTAIPIYEHQFLPPPHIAHVPPPMAMPMHHHHHAAAAAASSYSPVAVSQLAAAAAVAAATQQQQQQQQQHQQHHHQTNQHYAASSSNQQQQVAAYHPTKVHSHQQSHSSTPPTAHHQAIHHAAAIFQPIPAANQIINTYIPAAPIFVDETGGLYGTYGNAYGRYDGGYQLW